MDKLAGPSTNIRFRGLCSGNSKGRQLQCAAHFYFPHFLTNFSTKQQFYTIRGGKSYSFPYQTDKYASCATGSSSPVRFDDHLSDGRGTDIRHKVATLSLPLFVYVFCILQNLLPLLSLYPYELIDWWWWHHGSILPLYGRGKVVSENLLKGQHFIEGGRGV